MKLDRKMLEELILKELTTPFPDTDSAAQSLEAQAAQQKDLADPTVDDATTDKIDTTKEKAVDKTKYSLLKTKTNKLNNELNKLPADQLVNKVRELLGQVSALEEFKMNDKELMKIIMQEMHMLGKESPYEMDDSPKSKMITLDLSKEEFHDDEGQMAKSNLYKAAKSCIAMHNMLEDNEQLEGWVQEKIAVASSMLQSVSNYLEYQKISGK